MLPHAIAARYDCNEKLGPCHEGTRTNVLSDVYNWVNSDRVIQALASGELDVDQLKSARVFWINGPGSAGTGKSTIAYTVARDLDQQDLLGASFFCARDVADCSTPSLIFPTLAYQLGKFCPAFQQQISAVLQADSDVAFSVISSQIVRLLVQPLQAVRDKMPFCVVVIDALDECQDGGATSVILSSLAPYVADLFPLKFLITSRPEPHIVDAFRVTNLDQVTQRYILHHVEPKVVESDIQVYLHSSLQKTKELYQLDDYWPAAQDVSALVKLSSGLFIFAATAAKYIQDRQYNDPQRQLQGLLKAMTDTDSSSGTLLDELYLQILNNAFPSISSDFASRLKVVLGSIVLLFQPLSSLSLQQLLGVAIPVSTTLQHLQSVVVYPHDENDPIHLIHPSFYDFLTNPRRCNNPAFMIKSELQHSLLAQACLKTMNLLVQDPCHIQHLCKLHCEIENLPTTINQHIPLFLQYACRYWSHHVSCGLISGNLLQEIGHFCRNQLLKWIEVCSLLGDLRAALVALRKIGHIVSVSTMNCNYN